MSMSVGSGDFFMRPTLVLVPGANSRDRRRTRSEPTADMREEAERQKIDPFTLSMRALWPERNSGIDFDYASQRRYEQIAESATLEERELWSTGLSSIVDSAHAPTSSRAAPEILWFRHDPRESWIYSDGCRLRRRRDEESGRASQSYWDASRGIRDRIGELEDFFKDEGHLIVFRVFKMIRVELADGQKLAASIAQRRDPNRSTGDADSELFEIFGEVLSELDRLRRLCKEHPHCYVAKKCGSACTSFFQEFDMLPKLDLYRAKKVSDFYEALLKKLAFKLEHILLKIKGIGPIRLMMPTTLVTELRKPQSVKLKVSKTNFEQPPPPYPPPASPVL